MAKPKKPKTARAVYPNAGVDAWYRGQLQTLVTTMSRDLLAKVQDAYRDGGGLAQDARPKPSTPVLLEKALSKWGGVWTRRIESASTRIAWNFAAKNAAATDAGVKKVLLDAGFAVKFKATKGVKTAYEAVIAENVGLIKTIPQRYLADVQAMVWQSVMSGADMQTLTQNIQSKYGVAYRRAALIARDQNNKAKAAMEKARRKDLGITKAIWQHSHAGKEPRPTHVAMDGESYDIEQGMWDSDVEKYVWPGTEINCRCTDRAVIPGFE